MPRSERSGWCSPRCGDLPHALRRRDPHAGRVSTRELGLDHDLVGRDGGHAVEAFLLARQRDTKQRDRRIAGRRALRRRRGRQGKKQGEEYGGASHVPTLLPSRCPGQDSNLRPAA